MIFAIYKQVGSGYYAFGALEEILNWSRLCGGSR
jgi:hypothetical protein